MELLEEVLLGLPALRIAVVIETKLASIRLGNAGTFRGIPLNDYLTYLDKIVKIPSDRIILDAME